MTSGELMPRLEQRFQMVTPRIYRARILGVPESLAEQRIQALPVDRGSLEYGISAKDALDAALGRS